MTDITKLLQLAVPEIVRLTNDSIVLLDKKGMILYTNDRVESWLGYKKEELVGKNIALIGLMSVADMAKAFKNLVLRFQGKEIPPYSLDFTAKGGRVVTSTVKAQLIKDENGKILADLIILTDGSEKKQYEKYLALEKEMTGVYIDIVGLIIVILEKDGKISLLNKKGCEILQTTKKEAIGKNWFESFIPVEDRVKVKEIFVKIIGGNTDGVDKFENKIITATGEERLIAWHNAYLKDEQGNIYAILSSGEDITDRVEQENKLAEKTEELKKLNDFMVNRELEMVKLKKEVEELKNKK